MEQPKSLSLENAEEPFLTLNGDDEDDACCSLFEEAEEGGGEQATITLLIHSRGEDMIRPAQ